MAATATGLLPNASVAVLPGATHHSMPSHDPGPLTAALVAFLAAER